MSIKGIQFVPWKISVEENFLLYLKVWLVRRGGIKNVNIDKPEVGKKQKTEGKKKRRERLNDGNNNGQATHGARKHAWRTQAAWAKNLK